MEITKIKISPEVLKNDVSQITYSGNTFGYYSGLTEYLSQTVITDYSYRYGGPAFPGNFILSVNTISFDGGFSFYDLQMSRFTIDFIDTLSFFQKLSVGQKIVMTKSDGSVIDFFLNEPTSNSGAIIFVKLKTLTNFIEFTNGEIINLNIVLNISSFTDLSIPLLLKQTHEDIGYYSPFDGFISQLDNTLNFIFTADTLNPQTICISNTSDTSLVYLDETVYNVNWGDTNVVETISVFFPESLCHYYNEEVDSLTYNISLTGTNKLGNFVVTKSVTIPFTSTLSTNEYGQVNFFTNNGSWAETPSQQKYINFWDADNTISGQVSSNFVSVPFIVSGYTTSRLNDLQGFGINPYVVGKVVILDDGTTGKVTLIDENFTGYTINNQDYIDFPNGISIFLASSSGLTSDMLSQSAITKFEYLMNVIEEPEIQSNVFIERGKNSALESFRRIGEINNIVGLQNYGYGFFNLRNYNDI